MDLSNDTTMLHVRIDSELLNSLTKYRCNIEREMGFLPSQQQSVVSLLQFALEWMLKNETSSRTNNKLV